jgi:hypothetical protein
MLMLPKAMDTDQEMTSQQYSQRGAQFVGISRRL